MNPATTSAQIHFEESRLSVHTNEFKHNEKKLVSLGFGPVLGSMDVYMTIEQFDELIVALQNAKAAMTAPEFEEAV